MEIISRTDAKMMNLTSYFTGEPCKNGHIAKRNTNSGVCFLCSNVAGNRWYHTNKKDIEWKKRRIINNVKNRCRKTGTEFNIGVEDLVWPEYCPVLNILLDYSNSTNNRWNQVSLDRTNPKLGYVKGNVVVMSMRANSVKQDSTIEELEMLLTYLKSIS